MGRRDRSLPTTNAKRSRAALWVCGVLAIILGSAALYGDQFAYSSRFGLGSTSFLILLGLFFLVLAVSWHPRTHD